MAGGWGAAGLAGGFGKGLENIGNMGFQYGMQKMQNQNAQEMQQNNPYVRLAAMKQMGGGGMGAGAGTGATGSAADLVSQRMNPDTYGKPGHPGGASDPEGNFDPATIPLFGEEHKGMNIVQGGREGFQKQVVPIANAYMQTKNQWDEALQKTDIMKQQIAKGRKALEATQAKLIAEYGPNQYGQTDEWQQARQAMDAQETRYREFVQQMSGLRQAMAEYGGQLSQILPGLEIPEGQNSLQAGETPTLEHQQGGVRPPMREASPYDLGSRIYPQGQIPASMMTRNYNPVMPRGVK